APSDLAGAHSDLAGALRDFARAPGDYSGARFFSWGGIGVHPGICVDSRAILGDLKGIFVIKSVRASSPSALGSENGQFGEKIFCTLFARRLGGGCRPPFWGMDPRGRGVAADSSKLIADSSWRLSLAWPNGRPVYRART